MLKVSIIAEVVLGSVAGESAVVRHATLVSCINVGYDMFDYLLGFGFLDKIWIELPRT